MQAYEQKLEEACQGPNKITAGAALGWVEGNREHTSAHGHVSVAEEAAEMRADTVMWAASCTKLMATVAALQCVERGHFSLDQDVSSILPELRELEILTGFDEKSGEPKLQRANGHISLRRLLTHSSGLSYDLFTPLLIAYRKQQGVEPMTLAGNIALGYTAPLTFEPGQSWEYGCGIDWAGQMVERVNGNVRLGDYMAEHIWKPLDMTSTTFRLLERTDLDARLCGMTMRLPTGALAAGPTAMMARDPKDDLGGAGSYTTAQDYLKLLASLMRNDGKVLKPETRDEMFKPQLEDPSHYHAALAGDFGPYLGPGLPHDASIKWDWGLGGSLAVEGIPGRAGRRTMFWGGLPNLQWWIDPETETCGIYASQLVPPGDQQSAELFTAFQNAVFTGSSSPKS